MQRQALHSTPQPLLQATPTPVAVRHPLLRLWSHLQPRRRRQFSALLLLMVLASFAEVVSIGSVLPFLGVLTAPEKVFAHPLAQPLIQALGLTQPRQLLVPFTLAFAVAILAATGIRLLVLWASTRLSYAAGADRGLEVFRRTLYQPYSVHVSRNSSEVINGVTTQTEAAIHQALRPVLLMLSSGMMLGTVLLAMLAFEPVITAAVFAGFALIYLAIARLTRRRLLQNSQRIAESHAGRIKALQEGLGGIRDLLIDGTQPTYCGIYQQADRKLRHAQAQNTFISESPRLLLEALGMALIALLALALALQQNGLERTLPLLGALALGAQRLLPLLQQVYASWAALRGARQSLLGALSLLDQPLPAHATQPAPPPLPFEQRITFQQVGFKFHPEGPWVLHGLDLVIAKGQRIGFIGTTGSGKSTLLDLLMGLLHPVKGQIDIDGEALTAANALRWQRRIAHVPQAIYLADATIAENIAFGIPRAQVDMARVRAAAEQARIADTIEGWHAGYDTMVGERGVRLSGGQRQRIGIARALYKQADILVFDEATSALDSETESAVMQAIEALGRELTIIIVAHRVTTLRNCDQIIELASGRVQSKGTYSTMVAEPEKSQISRRQALTEM